MFTPGKAYDQGGELMMGCYPMDPARELHEATKRDLTAEVLRHFGEVRLRVTGTSMLPTLWPGDILTVRLRNAEQLVPGELVLCYRNRAFVAHRLVGKRGDGFITRGDSLPGEDSPFRHDEVLGEVFSIIRNSRPVVFSPVWTNSIGARVWQHSELCIRLLLRLERLSRLATLLWAN